MNLLGMVGSKERELTYSAFPGSVSSSSRTTRKSRTGFEKFLGKREKVKNHKSRIFKVS